jgi:hypothetical protein
MQGATLYDTSTMIHDDDYHPSFLQSFLSSIMDPKEVANPSQDVILPPLVQNSSTDICSPDANPEAADSATKEVKDGRREGKTFPKESIMNVTVDKSNTESIDIMTRFIDMCLSNGGYDLCLGYTNRTKFMHRIVNEEFKYDGIFNE